jgi:hypothetical protein
VHPWAAPEWRHLQPDGEAPPLLRCTRGGERIRERGRSAPWTTPEQGRGETCRRVRERAGRTGGRNDHQRTPAADAVAGGESWEGGEGRAGRIGREPSARPQEDASNQDRRSRRGGEGGEGGDGEARREGREATNAITGGEAGSEATGAMAIWRGRRRGRWGLGSGRLVNAGERIQDHSPSVYARERPTS